MLDTPDGSGHAAGDSGSEYLCPDELPFSFDITLSNGAQHLLEDLVLKPHSPLGDALSSLIANCAYAAARGANWVFYSRDRDHYGEIFRATPKRPGFYTLHSMTGAVDILEKAKLIEHWRTPSSPCSEYRSRIRASPALLVACARLTANDYAFRPRSAIVLKDAAGKLMPLPQTRAVARMRRDVEEHNAFLSSVEVGIDNTDAHYDAAGFLHVGHLWFNPHRRSYHRVFNQRFSLGGRWYGPFWQGLPKAVRQTLLIGGEPTLELDYRACHLRLLCALAHLELPFHDARFDPFAIPGFERDELKLTFNILLNVKSNGSAITTLAKALADRHLDTCEEKAKTTISAFIAHFPGLERFWKSGMGLRLQNYDAAICARVQRRLRQDHIACLSVHDSFIVAHRNKLQADAAMKIEMNAMCDKLASAL